MIEFNNISKIYYSQGAGQIFALEDVSFRVDRGEFLSIVGKSGAGKTTLIKLLIGEERPTNGSVVFCGLDVARMRPHGMQKVRRKIGVVHQDYKLLSSKTVKENLCYIMEVIGVSEVSIKRDVPRVLEIVGLGKRGDNFPQELSGGEKQRLAIARALIHRPELIIADEPTGNLDLYNTYDIVHLLTKVNSMGTTVILSTHDKEIVDGLRRRVITLDNGKLISDDQEGRFIL